MGEFYKEVGGEEPRGFVRLRKRRDFQRIRREGKRLNSKNYNLIFRKNDLPHNRLAIAVGKKVGNAVKRNYEKRICREIYRDLKNSLPVGFDFLIIVKNVISRESKKKSLKGASSKFLERKDELKRLFEQIK